MRNVHWNHDSALSSTTGSVTTSAATTSSTGASAAGSRDATSTGAASAGASIDTASAGASVGAGADSTRALVESSMVGISSGFDTVVSAGASGVDSTEGGI